MRITDLWYRLEETFGAGYAASVARDQVFAQLGGRTIDQALVEHVEVQEICLDDADVRGKREG